MTRPPFLIAAADIPEEDSTYPDSTERMSFGRALGRAAGLEKIGIHIERVPPGRRTSYPHAEGEEEEFVYVLDGEIDAWIDGTLHRMRTGDFAGFPSGTGICHSFLNNGSRDALLLVGGERSRPDNRIFYPLNPERRPQLKKPEHWWHDIPLRPQGDHDGRAGNRLGAKARAWADQLRAEGLALPADRLAAFAFGGDAAMARDLAALVVAGAKTATSSLHCLWEIDREPLPRAGDLAIVTLWDGSPAALIEITEVELRPFRTVDAAFAAAEGEGDRSLDHWRRLHRDYFTAELAPVGRTFADDLLLVTERFRLLRAAPTAPAQREG